MFWSNIDKFLNILVRISYLNADVPQIMYYYTKFSLKIPALFPLKKRLILPTKIENPLDAEASAIQNHFMKGNISALLCKNC